MPKRPIVLVVTGEFPLPSETFVIDQIIGLIDRGFDVRVLATRPRKAAPTPPNVVEYSLLERTYYWDATKWFAEKSTGLKLILRLLRGGRIGLAFEAVRLALDWKSGGKPATTVDNLVGYGLCLEDAPQPDFVLCHFGNNGDLMVRLRAGLHKKWPIGTHFHGYDISSAIQNLGPGVYRRLFKDGDWFLPVSNYFGTRLVQLGAPSERVEVIRMGVSHRVFETLLPQKLTAEESAFRLVSVGRLVEKKGHEFAIRALAVCRDAMPSVTFELKIVGDGPLMEELDLLIDTLKLRGIVELQGALPREDIFGLLAQADAFILASVTAKNGDQEGVPVAIEEAMAFALPVISTLHSGIPEVVRENINGLLAPERDHIALSKAIRTLVENRSLGVEMGREGKTILESELDVDIWMDKLKDGLFQRIARI